MPTLGSLTKPEPVGQASDVSTSAAVDAADFLDLADPSVVADPYPHLAHLRAAAPVAWHSGLGAWVATSHEVCGAVLRDRRLCRVFRPRTPESDWETFNWLHADSLLDIEPP